MNASQVVVSRPDNRVVAEQKDLAVLELVHEYGHLRRSEVMRGVWPKSPPRYAAKISQRVVRRLVNGGYLAERPNSLGGRSLVLAAKGVARLQSVDVSAQTGHELSSVAGPQFFHRTIGTCYLLERAARGDFVVGEYALFKSRHGFKRAELTERFGKIPDGIAIVPGRVRGYDTSTQPNLRAADWVEVESSFKSRPDLERILALAWRVGEWLDTKETLLLDRVVFVYDAKQPHERMLLRTIKRYLQEHPLENPEHILQSIVLVRCTVDLPLVFRGYEGHSALELLRTTDLTASESE